MQSIWKDTKTWKQWLGKVRAWGVLELKAVSLSSAASETCGGSRAVSAPQPMLAAQTALSKELMWGHTHCPPKALWFHSSIITSPIPNLTDF